MENGDGATVSLVRIDAACMPGGQVELSSPELTGFREGDYPGQWRGGMRRRGRVLELVVSPDRIGKVEASFETSGRPVFRASGWDFEVNSDELRARVMAALRDEMERFAGKVQVSLDSLLAHDDGPKPK